MYLHIFDIHMMHMFCIPDTFHLFFLAQISIRELTRALRRCGASAFKPYLGGTCW